MSANKPPQGEPHNLPRPRQPKQPEAARRRASGTTFMVRCGDQGRHSLLVKTNRPARRIEMRMMRLIVARYSQAPPALNFSPTKVQEHPAAGRAAQLSWFR